MKNLAASKCLQADVLISLTLVKYNCELLFFYVIWVKELSIRFSFDFTRKMQLSYGRFAHCRNCGIHQEHLSCLTYKLFIRERAAELKTLLWVSRLRQF